MDLAAEECKQDSRLVSVTFACWLNRIRRWAQFISSIFSLLDHDRHIALPGEYSNMSNFDRQ